jgi:hypothetical protein
VQHLVAVEGGLASSEDRLVELSRLTGLSRYEARTRLRLLETRPGIIASFADEEMARALAGNLRASGFPAFAISTAHEEARVQVRTFGFEGTTLRVDGGEDGSLEVSTEEVRLLLHGLRLIPGTPRNAGSRVRVVYPGFVQYGTARPGLGREEQFVHVYAPGMPAIVFCEGDLRFAQSPGALEPTRAGNFARVVGQLREHCKRATYDNRLLTRGGQKSILGPTLRPEHHLDIAISLLTRGQHSSSPYR